jgi:hypothetical protein
VTLVSAPAGRHPKRENYAHRGFSALAAICFVLALALSGCGNSAEKPSSHGASKPSASPSASPSVTKVDDQVICQLIFDVKDGLGPVKRIIDFWDKDSISPAQLSQLKEDSTAVKDLAARAQSPLSDQVAALAAVIDSYVAAAESGTATTATKTDLQSAGLSLTNTCEDYF